MNETLQEFVDSRGVAIRVDREQALIRGVKVLGLKSRNGRAYLPEALAEAAGLYEEVKVNVNHPKGNPLGVRDYQDRLGILRNVQARPNEGLFADLHFNPKHSLAEQLLWDAEHLPENVGFSHNVQARTSRRGNEVVVEAITKVQSVDLVADPATTRGLFESAGEAAHAQPPDDIETNGPLKWEDVTLEDLRHHRADLVESVLAAPSAEVASLQEEVDRLSAANTLLEKRLVARRLLSEYQFPDPDLAIEGWARSVVSEQFLDSLLASPDEEAMRALVEERSNLIRGAQAQGVSSGRPGTRPLSRDQHQVYGAGSTDAKTFVEAISSSNRRTRS